MRKKLFSQSTRGVSSDQSDKHPPSAIDTAAYSSVTTVLECGISVRIYWFCVTSSFHSGIGEYVGRKNMSIAFHFFFTVVPCILVLSKSFMYQLMHNRVALKEY